MITPEREGVTPDQQRSTQFASIENTSVAAEEMRIGSPVEVEFYELAELLFEARTDELKQSGELRRLPEITTDEDLDAHFGRLAGLYRATCAELGLPWPPIPEENIPRDEGVRRIEVKAEPDLEPPSLEQLMQWEWEGYCEAACEFQCVVEPDGTCEHGKPSWLLELGLI